MGQRRLGDYDKLRRPSCECSCKRSCQEKEEVIRRERVCLRRQHIIEEPDS